MEVKSRSFLGYSVTFFCDGDLSSSETINLIKNGSCSYLRHGTFVIFRPCLVEIGS